MKLKKVVYVSILYTLEVLSVLNIIPAIIGAVGAIGGGLLASKSAKSSAQAYHQGAQEANETQIRLAKENREFERDTAYEMMQRRHQWEVADLRAAGLNPILSAHSAPSMGNVSADTPPIQNTQAQAIEAGKIHASAAQQVFSNLLAFRQQKNNNLMAEKQAEYNSALTAKTNADIEETYQKIRADLPKAQANHYASSARNLNEQSLNLAKTRDMIGVQIDRERAQISEIEARREEVYAQIGLIESQKKHLRSQTHLNHLYGELARTERELNIHRARSEQLGQVEKVLVNAGLMAGLSEKDLWKRIYDEGHFALDSFQWLRKSVLEFLDGVDEDTIKRLNQRGRSDRPKPDFELSPLPNTQWTGAYD